MERGKHAGGAERHAAHFRDGRDISLFGDSAAHAAGGGYGPGIAGPAAAPGGFSSIVTTHAFGPTGGTVSANVPGGEAD